PVDPDQYLVTVALAGGDDPRLDAVERRQIAPRHRLHVDVVQPPVLVAAGVLYVKQVPAVPRPGEEPDAPVGVLGDHLRAVPVHAVGADRGDPHVEHPVTGRDPGQLAAVGRDVRTDALGVAKEHFTGDEINHEHMPTTLREAPDPVPGRVRRRRTGTGGNPP